MERGYQQDLATSYGLRSTGLVVFTGRIISAFTGLLFTVMATRWLSVPGFGTWEVIVTLVTFSAYPVGTVAYWATRDVARGRMVGRTAIFSGALLSGLGLVLYFAFTFVTYSTIASAVLPFLLGALVVPLSYWSAVANSIVQGFRPGVYGYSLVISEVAKLVVAYESLYVFRLGIEGVILALMAAYLVQSLVSTYLVRLTTAEKFDFAQTKKWSRLAWLPAISYLPTVLAVADTYVAAVGFGTSLVGYYQVAFIVASVVGYSSGLAFSLYPLLLRGGNERLPALTMDFTLLFSIPMAVGCVVLATPILFLFGAGKYLPGANGLAILAVTCLLGTVSGIVDQTLLGTERVDVGEKPKFWSLIRSNLLFVPVANILYGVAYLTSLYIALSYSSSHGFSASSSVAIWATVQLAATIAFVIAKARRARRYAKLTPSVSVAYNLLAAGLMAAVVYIISLPVLDQSVGTLSYGARLLGIAVIGAGVYFAIVYALDSKFRDLSNSLLPRLRR
jgi:O-antigen/teichoic acid export membrane protein